MVQARLELRASHLGVDPPPVSTHVRATPRGDGWLLYLWNANGVHEPILAWIGKYAEVEKHEHFSERPRLITLSAKTLPERWVSLFTDHGVDLLVFESEGAVRLVLRRTRSELRSFLAELGADPKTAILHSLGPAPKPTQLLTDRQREALLQALTAGYYEVPRRIQLSTLADKMDMSEGALSELLRRGEVRVLKDFFEWDTGADESEGGVGGGQDDDS